MHLISQIAVLVAVISSTNLAAAFVALVPLVTKVVDRHNYRYINGTTKIIQSGPPTNQTFAEEFELYREFKDIKITSSYHVVTSKGVMQDPLLRRSFDFCVFLRRPTMDRLVKLVYDQVKRNTNIPSKCPIKPGQYYIRDLKPSRMAMPGLLPETEFVLKMLFQTGPMAEPALDYQVTGKLVRVMNNVLEKKDAS